MKNDKKISSSEEVKEILCQNVALLAEKSKECELEELRKNTEVINEVFKSLSNYCY